MAEEISWTHLQVKEAQKLELDLLFSFPAFLEYQHLKDIFSLVDINTKELK